MPAKNRTCSLQNMNVQCLHCDIEFALEWPGWFRIFFANRGTYPKGYWGCILLALGTIQVLLWTTPRQYRWCMPLLPTWLKQNISVCWQPYLCQCLVLLKFIQMSSTVGMKSVYVNILGQVVSVGIATRYGLDGPRIKSRWRRNLPHPSRPDLGSTPPPTQWVACFFRGGKAAVAWRSADWLDESKWEWKVLTDWMRVTESEKCWLIGWE